MEYSFQRPTFSKGDLHHFFLSRGDSHMNQKRQIHDGIAGGLITLGVMLGMYVNPTWLWLPGILGVTLLQSGFTGFCPLYYILDQTCPEK